MATRPVQTFNNVHTTINDTDGNGGDSEADGAVVLQRILARTLLQWVPARETADGYYYICLLCCRNAPAAAWSSDSD